MPEDWQTIERVLSGDTAAFRTLVESYQKLVFQFARNMLSGIQDAEDLTQDVFVCAFQNLATFDRSKGQWSTWLLTIARNRCCNHLKRRREALPQFDTSDPRPMPEEVVSQQEIWLHLDAALESLPIEQRTAFVLAEIQELPHAEIAAIEGIELGTVKSRVSRARERLRQTMKAWQPEIAPPSRSQP